MSNVAMNNQVPVLVWTYIFFFFSLKRFYLFILRQRGREGKRERNINVRLLLMCSHWDLARNPGMCPDWESNWRPFGLQAGAQSFEPHQPGLDLICDQGSPLP